MEHVPPVFERWLEQLQPQYDHGLPAHMDGLRSDKQFGDNLECANLIASKKHHWLQKLHLTPYVLDEVPVEDCPSLRLMIHSWYLRDSPDSLASQSQHFGRILRTGLTRLQQVSAVHCHGWAGVFLRGNNTSLLMFIDFHSVMLWVHNLYKVCVRVQQNDQTVDVTSNLLGVCEKTAHNTKHADTSQDPTRAMQVLGSLTTTQTKAIRRA